MDNNKAWEYALGMIKVDGLKPSKEYLDLIELKYREKHFQRMKDGICVDPGGGVYDGIVGGGAKTGDGDAPAF